MKRQPVHTVYGGANLFKSDTNEKLGSLALKSMEEYAPDAITFAKVLDIDDKELAQAIYQRVIEKLKKEPVEDFRIDFEDGYGYRSDSEEDGHAQTAASELAKSMQENSTPPFIGIRIKPLNGESETRGKRTLDIFINALIQETNGKIPNNFVVNLPKVSLPEEVSNLAELLNTLEQKHGLNHYTLKMEIMIETPQAIINPQGKIALQDLVKAGKGRCIAAHFGAYDYTAALDIAANYQLLDHPTCSFARQLIKIALADTGIWLSDGATNIIPIAPHKGSTLSDKQKAENIETVHEAWKINYKHVCHSLSNGYYQGWDLHPAQLPIRYAACYAFFLKNIAGISHRLKSFVEKSAQATLSKVIFDDAATGQGLLNFYLRGINCGAITEDELKSTGLTLAEIRNKSFVKTTN